MFWWTVVLTHDRISGLLFPGLSGFVDSAVDHIGIILSSANTHNHSFTMWSWVCKKGVWTESSNTSSSYDASADCLLPLYPLIFTVYLFLTPVSHQSSILESGPQNMNTNCISKHIYLIHSFLSMYFFFMTYNKQLTVSVGQTYNAYLKSDKNAHKFAVMSRNAHLVAALSLRNWTEA